MLDRFAAAGVLAVLVVGAGSCLEPGVSRCPSGTVCPPGFLCVDVSGADLSLCVHREPAWCAFQDPLADAPCAAGMVCHAPSRLCVSVGQFEACAGRGNGEPCTLAGFEEGLVCRGGACVLPYCGDGFIDASEGCDDGNDGAGDGCSATCQVEEGWACVGAGPGSCEKTCGDGERQAPEGCDDGNDGAGDGCSATCQVEEGWTCDEALPSACATTCGDGLRAGLEACDGLDLGGATCTSRGFGFGILRCREDCTLDDAACAVGVEIPAGVFQQGSPEDEPGREDDETPRQVTLTRALLLQATEVTGGQYVAVMGYCPIPTGCDDLLPVDDVTWNEAAAYLNALSRAEGRPACYVCSGQAPEVFCEPLATLASPYDCEGFRLPTEAEWEHAARAGTTTATYNGTSTLLDCEHPNPVLDPIAWFCGDAYLPAFPVGLLAPTPWGAYDLLGNVAEWVQDVYDDYAPGDQVDPWGATPTGAFRVVRGGHTDARAALIRASSRSSAQPHVTDGRTGFRPARTLP